MGRERMLYRYATQASRHWHIILPQYVLSTKQLFTTNVQDGIITVGQSVGRSFGSGWLVMFITLLASVQLTAGFRSH